MFTPEVIEQLQYYVYRLIDPRTGNTFYVGKGKGNRLYAHINDALKNFVGESYMENDESEVSAKIQQIREIRNAGLQVIHVIQRYGLSKKEALEVEAALIDCFPGLTNISKGYSSERGVTNAETLQRDLSCEEYKENRFLEYCIIKINNQKISEHGGSIYETVRSAWKVSERRIKKIKIVLAVNNGIVKEVYRVNRWRRNIEEPDRFMFDGVIAEDEIRDQFVNKRIPKNYRVKGMASPLLYHDECNCADIREMKARQRASE